MNKKILSLAIALVMILGTFTSVMAADYDLIHKLDAAKNTNVLDFMEDLETFEQVAGEFDKYELEFGGEKYAVEAVEEKLNAGAKDLKAAIEQLKDGEEEPAEGLEVVEVSAINAAQIKIVFNKAVDEDTIIPANFFIGLTKDLSNDFAALNSSGYSIDLLDDEKTVLISADDLSVNTIWEDEYTASGAGAALQTDSGDVLKNRTVYVQLKDIRTADGKLQSAMETSFVARDNEGPKFAETSYSVEEVTEDPVITFSEPVEFANVVDSASNPKPAQFYLNGTNVTDYVYYADTSDKTVAGYSKVTVDLTTATMELEEGNNTFEVVGIKDLSGNATSPGRLTTTIKVQKADETTTAPKVVEIKQVHDGAFVVVFDKPVVDGGTITIKNLMNDNKDAIYDIDNTDPVSTGTVTIAVPGTSNGTTLVDDEYYTAPANTTNTAYYVEFVDVDTDRTTDSVYQGANEIIRTVIVEDYKTTSASGTDYKGAKHTKSYKFAKDNKAPTVKDWEIDTNDVVVEFEDALFNGDVVDGSPTDKMVVKYVDGGITYTYEITAPTGTTSNKLALGLTGGSSGNAPKLFQADGTTIKPGITFTVKLPYGLVQDKIDDSTPQYNGPFVFIGDTITVTTSGQADGEGVPQTSQANIHFNKTENLIKVGFVGESVKASTATNKANYRFDGKALPAGTVVEYAEKDTADTDVNLKKVVYIYLPANSVVRDGNYQLEIKDVATNSGAKMLPTEVTVYDVGDNTQPVVTKAVVTSDNTVEVTFDETLSGNTVGTAATTGNVITNAERNFKVIINGVEFNASSVTAKNSRTLVITTASTFPLNLGVSVKIANDASNDMFVKDLAGNGAAAKTITATIDLD